MEQISTGFPRRKAPGHEMAERRFLSARLGSEMSDKLKAWAHWAKLTPIDEDQREMALEIERLLKSVRALEDFTAWLEAGFAGMFGAPGRPKEIDAYERIQERLAELRGGK
jgi:hypothetical protein